MTVAVSFEALVIALGVFVVVVMMAPRALVMAVVVPAMVFRAYRDFRALVGVLGVPRVRFRVLGFLGFLDERRRGLLLGRQ